MYLPRASRYYLSHKIKEYLPPRFILQYKRYIKKISRVANFLIDLSNLKILLYFQAQAQSFRARYKVIFSYICPYKVGYRETQ